MPDLLPVSLARRQPARIRPQLEALREVLADLGHPERSLRSILVVGSNGKGSTVAMLERIVAAHGLRTGLYTSPHLIRVSERIRIDGAPIAEAHLEGLLARLDRYPDLTFFETLTAVALLAFAEAAVECAVLEAGMGGRWDATRAAESEIAGLTNVGSDHATWLGERLEERAGDKGEALAAAPLGVYGSQIDRGLVPHLRAPNARSADDLVEIHRVGPCTVAAWWRDSHGRRGETVELRLPLAGDHQLYNLQLALALAHCAAELGWISRLDGGAVRTALGQVEWPGRLTTHLVRGRRVLVDCAHNAEGVQALALHLSRQPVLYHLLFSCLDDKPVEVMAELLRPHVGNVVICPLKDERAASLERLCAAFPEAVSGQSVAEALGLLPAPVVAAGSVRLAGELLAYGEEEFVQ